MKGESYRSVVDYLWQRDRQRDGGRASIGFDGAVVCQDEYWSRMEHYRRYFLSSGFTVGCGKPVTICNLNAPEYEFIYFSLMGLGAVASTVSLPFFKSDVYRHTVEKGAETIVLSVEYCSDELRESFAMLGDNVGERRVRKVIFTSAGDYRPEGKAAAYDAAMDHRAMITSLGLPKNIEVVYPGEIKRLGDGTRLEYSGGAGADLAASYATYSNTGGTTTGIPKCAVHTHRAILSMLTAHERDSYPDFPLREGDKALLLIPISHITAQFYALILRRAFGACIVYNPGAFEPHLLVRALVEDGINDVIATFGLYNVIAHSPLAKGDLKALRIPTCGGEATPKAPARVVNERMSWAGSVPLYVGGGSTEFGSAIMNAYGLEDRENETGLSLPGVDNIIVNPLTGRKARDGDVGIIYSNCPWQMEGYLGDPKSTSEFFNYVDGEGKAYGTNGDIGKVVRTYGGKPVFAMQGRVMDFVRRSPDTGRYSNGVTLTGGKVDPIDFTEGDMLFSIRDKALNAQGVLEAEALLLPHSEADKSGAPVVNVVIAPGADPFGVLKEIFSIYNGEGGFKPIGVIFRSGFARSLATDKRDVLSLMRDRGPYHGIREDGSAYSVTLPKGGEPTYSELTETSVIEVLSPPVPRKIRVVKA